MGEAAAGSDDEDGGDDVDDDADDDGAGGEGASVPESADGGMPRGAARHDLFPGLEAVAVKIFRLTLSEFRNRKVCVWLIWGRCAPVCMCVCVCLSGTGDRHRSGAMCGFCLRVFTPPRECARALRRSRPRILAPQEYMEGDSRFRKMKLQRINVRKVIRMWADKERMNLLRMTRAAVPCPRPLKLKGHVLIMSFIGVSARFCMFACVRTRTCCVNPRASRRWRARGGGRRRWCASAAAP